MGLGFPLASTSRKPVPNSLSQFLHQDDIRNNLRKLITNWLIKVINYENCCRLKLFSRNLYTSSGDKLKVVVLLYRVERDKTLEEIENSQLGEARFFGENKEEERGFERKGFQLGLLNKKVSSNHYNNNKRTLLRLPRNTRYPPLFILHMSLRNRAR
jgi:hypothetical protein